MLASDALRVISVCVLLGKLGWLRLPSHQNLRSFLPISLRVGVMPRLKDKAQQRTVRSEFSCLWAPSKSVMA